LFADAGVATTDVTFGICFADRLLAISETLAESASVSLPPSVRSKTISAAGEAACGNAFCCSCDAWIDS